MAKEKKQKAKDRRAGGGDDDDNDDEELLDEMGEVNEEKKSEREAQKEAALRKHAHDRVIAKYIRTVMEPEHASNLMALDLLAADKMYRTEDGDDTENPQLPLRASTFETMQQMVQELVEPFSDVKHVFTRFTSPSAHRLFYLLTGETSRTLREGMVMPVTINGIHPAGKGAYVKLDSGIRGFLAFRNVSDSAPMPPRRDQFADPGDMQREMEDNLTWLKARLSTGLTVTARVLRIEKDKFSVELSTKTSDLNPQSWLMNTDTREAKKREIAEKYGKPLAEEVDEIEASLYFHDPYLHTGPHPEDKEILQAEEGKERKEKRFRQRNITHTLFRNVSREEAVALLKDKVIGEVIVRPSSLGTNHLTLTWKVSDADSGVIDPAAPDAPPEKGIFFHVDILEENKPRDEFGNRYQVDHPEGQV